MAEKKPLCNYAGQVKELQPGDTLYLTGTVTSVSIVAANGISGSVATATTTPAITLVLEAITPTTVTASLGTLAAPAYSFTGRAGTGMYAADALDYIYVGLGGVIKLGVLGDQFQSYVKLRSAIAGGFLINANDGSTTNPTYTFQDDTDTGIYSSAADTLNFVTNNASRMALTNTALTLTGSLGVTGTRVSKGWFTDLEVTNTITGNAGTATKLAATKTINGVAFDGSGNITVPSDITAGTLGNFLVSNGTIWTSAAVTTAGIADSTDKRYCTDAQKVVIGNTSGTNSGNNAANSSSTYIGTTSVALNRGSGALSLAGVSIDGNAGTATKLAATKTINGVAFDGSADISTPTTGGVTHTANTDGFSESGGATSRTLTVSGGNVALIGGGVSEYWLKVANSYTTPTENPLTLHAITDLTATLEANSVYFYEYYLIASTNAVLNGCAFTPNYSGNMEDINWRTMAPLGRNVADDLPFYGAANDEMIMSTGQAALTGARNRYFHRIIGSVTTTTGTGNLKLQAKAEVVTTGTVTVHKGSYLRLTKTI